jgi:predicted component of type VI protein secretion system
MDALTPELLKLLQSVLEDAWDSLRPSEKARTTKTEVAVRILQVAARGERDLDRLRIEAVSGVVTSTL